MTPRQDPTNAQLAQAMAQLAQVVAQQVAAAAAQTAAQKQREAEENARRAEEDARRAQRAERELAQDQVRMRTDFNRHGPPKFEGEVEPEKADQWIQEMEKIFETLRTPDAERVNLAAFMLKGDAEYWWRSARQLMTANHVAITWESFKRAFMDKYFLGTAKEEMENQFLRLRQGTMTVGEYAAKLEALSKHFRFFQVQVDEAYLCNRFQRGLRNEIEKAVRPLGIRVYQQVVEKAREVEAMENRQRGRSGSGGPIRSSHQDYEERSKEKPPQKKHYDYRRDNNRVIGQNTPNATTYEGQGNQVQGKDVTCFKCGKVGHYANNCKGDHRVCFNCNKPGHVARDCNAPKVEVGATLKTARGKCPVTAG
ncbi:uncharacterized protein LOC130712862 [Lotus japonicus]|uniref:uncharacterized protein LOC130712862 n=1 Tax=Lotus japonicus TaxID=34305 RepID=UPI00258D0B57|nr:uncharacterized protein LOC130712862 [Lotus japonicus]